jgi:hypothetical protein
VTLHEVFVEAKKILTEHGWVQGQFRGPRSLRSPTQDPQGYCLVGSIRCAVSDRELFIGQFDGTEEEQALVEEAIDYLKTRAKISHIVMWNDMLHRTKLDVLDVLGQAISETAPEPPRGIQLELPTEYVEMPVVEEVAREEVLVG